MPIFDKDYWDNNYSQPESMDGIFNSDLHANYVYSYFKLESVEIKSILDLGMGFGDLLESFSQIFEPKKILGVEPSEFAFEIAQSKFLQSQTKQISIEQWCHYKENSKNRFDLAICTSVFQYIDKSSLEFIVEHLSRKIKYLYLTVPTDIELDRQIKEYEFKDSYAKRRTRHFYRSILNKHFTNISSKIWESKFYFNEQNSLFTDLLYRS